MTIQTEDNIHLIYPSSDGKPMAENTLQFEWIVKFKFGLEKTTEGQDIFIAGDLFWYPIEGNPRIRLAPDVMVAIGRPKGHRSSYLQWREDFIAPQVVIEILSPGNTRKEMKKKLKFYTEYGVDEYYIYDPDHNELIIYTRKANKLIPQPKSVKKWFSPLLNIEFYWTEEILELYHPNREPFLSYMDLVKLNRLAVSNFEEQLKKTNIVESKMEAAQNKLIETENKLEKAETRAESAETRAENAETRAENAETRAEKLAQKLKELGLNPDEI